MHLSLVSTGASVDGARERRQTDEKERYQWERCVCERTGVQLQFLCACSHLCIACVQARSEIHVPPWNTHRCNNHENDSETPVEWALLIFESRSVDGQRFQR